VNAVPVLAATAGHRETRIHNLPGAAPLPLAAMACQEHHNTLFFSAQMEQNGFIVEEDLHAAPLSI